MKVGAPTWLQTRSTSSSPLRSPAASSQGFSAVAYTGPAMNPPSPWPRKMRRLSSQPQVARSSWRSPLKSAHTREVGPSPAQWLRGGMKPYSAPSRTVSESPS